MDSVSPVLYVTFLAVMADMSSNILREYLDEHFETIQEMIRSTKQIRERINGTQADGLVPKRTVPGIDPGKK